MLRKIIRFEETVFAQETIKHLLVAVLIRRTAQDAHRDDSVVPFASGKQWSIDMEYSIISG